MKENRWPLVVSVTVLVLIMFTYHLLSARRGLQNYRDQHLGTALVYAHGKIDLLRPIIVGFNANDSPTPQELPVWQATAAVLFKLLGSWFGWANLASLLFFTTALWPLFFLSREYLGERGAWWVLVFFCSQPLMFYYAGRAGTDGSCEVFAIWFLYYADKLVRTGKWLYWLPAFGFGTLAATTKFPFFLCAGLTSFFLLLQHGRTSAIRWLQLGSVGLTAGIIFLIWNHYTEVCYARAEFALTSNAASDVKLSDVDSKYAWYFGDWRFGGAMFGSFALAGLAFWSLVYSGNRLARFWVASGLVTTLIFTHVVLHHHHYYLMFSPGVAMLCAAAVVRGEELAAFRQFRHQALFIATITILLLLSTLQGLIWMNAILDADLYPRRIAGVIQQYTGEQDKLLIEGGGWGGEQLILSNRKGLSIFNTRFLENPANLARIKALGYNRLVMISETPLLHAIQITKPGQIDLPRDTYESQLTPVAREWKTIFQSEDILIKEIPQ
jgi:hypothetical protein